MKNPVRRTPYGEFIPKAFGMNPQSRFLFSFFIFLLTANCLLPTISFSQQEQDTVKVNYRDVFDQAEGFLLNENYPKALEVPRIEIEKIPTDPKQKQLWRMSFVARTIELK